MKRITILALLAFLALGSQAQSLEDLLDNTIGVEEKTIPISATFKSVQLINSHTTKTPKTDYLFAHRMSYSAQLLIARKFNSNISVQLMPTYIHRNLVQTALFPNDILAIGAGGRFKVSNWIALTFEYHHMLNEIEASNTTTPLSIGVDLETGGHVFQLFFTNTSAIYAAGYISETSDKWMDGNIRFGFNISRTF
jgi:hypothetical protein